MTFFEEIITIIVNTFQVVFTMSGQNCNCYIDFAVAVQGKDKKDTAVIDYQVPSVISS